MSEPKTPTLTKEDLAFFIKSLWSSLLTPEWTRDSLIELGKSVFAKTSLDHMDDKKFGQLLPHLKVMAEAMASSMSAQIDAITQPLIEALKEVSEKNKTLTGQIEELQKKIVPAQGEPSDKVSIAQEDNG